MRIHFPRDEVDVSTDVGKLFLNLINQGAKKEFKNGFIQVEYDRFNFLSKETVDLLCENKIAFDGLFALFKLPVSKLKIKVPKEWPASYNKQKKLKTIFEWQIMLCPLV